MILNIVAALATSLATTDRMPETKSEIAESESVDDSELRDWIEAAVDGDMDAFRQLYDCYVPQVRRHVRRMVGPGAEVDDLIQEVFVQVHRSLDKFRHDSAFSTWLFGVTRNVTYSHLRKGNKTVDFSELRPLRAPAKTLARLEAREQVRSLYAVLEQVPVESREAFILFEVEQLKLREIAELTDASINTVAARVRRTRERLRTFLEASQAQENP